MLSNTLGTAILNRAVTAATFQGPPLILVGQGMTSTSDARWQAALTFAAGWGSSGSPLIGVNVPSGNSVEDLTQLDLGLRAILPYFAPSALPGFSFLWSNSPLVNSSPMVCGPILAIPDTLANQSLATSASWYGVSARYAHAPANHRYAFGNTAIGAGDPECLTGVYGPPVYPLSPANLSASLATLTNLWRQGAPVTQTAIQLLQNVELGQGYTARPGISRRIHPSLAASVVLTPP